VYPDLEQVRLSLSLERMREFLGPDHPVVKQALGTDTPDARAKALITGSKLADPKIRMALFVGGRNALEASKDPMIALARAIDNEARALRKTYEERVQAPEGQAQRAIADVRFAVYGTSLYPDATFTLGCHTARCRAGRRPASALSRLRIFRASSSARQALRPSRCRGRGWTPTRAST
jgi:hypothetical protein